MEPLAALGVAAAVIQFVDFGTRAGKYLQSVYATEEIMSMRVFEEVTKDLQAAASLMDERARRVTHQDLLIDSNETVRPLIIKTVSSLMREQAIRDIVAKCQAIARELMAVLTSIRDKLQDEKDGDKLPKKLPKRLLGALKAAWKSSDIEDMAEKLASYRSQLILRMLLTLDAKTDAGLSRQEIYGEILVKNTSQILEILTISQSKLGAAVNREEERVLDRLGYSEELKRKILEEVTTAILTLQNGETRVLTARPSTDSPVLEKDDAPGLVSHSQGMMRIGAQLGSPDTEATVLDDLRPARTAILRSLVFRHMTDKFDSVKPSHDSTNNWIFSNPKATDRPWSDFSAWLESDTDRCYWISGKAGSGKSTLMRFIEGDNRTLQHLQVWAGERQLSFASFFFAGFGNRLQKSQEGLLRALLYKLLSKDMSTIPIVMRELMFIAAVPQLGEGLSPPTLPELVKWITRLLKAGESKRYCFLIDGIDEYEGDPAAIVDLVSSLSQCSNVKFILPSRPIPACKMFSAADSTMLVDRIVDKSYGVFVWVFLSVKSLLRGLENHDNLEELQMILDELPSDLAELYEHMMNKMSPSYLKQAARLFRLAITAMDVQQHPLLTIQLSLAQDNQENHNTVRFLGGITDEEQWRRCDQVDGRIRSRCRGLLETRRALTSEEPLVRDLNYEFPCVDFLHRSVVEFLRDVRVWDNILEQSDGHGVDVACGCKRFILGQLC
ncbi:hypothetical protein OQA88_5587 [Cercophora sp. LCS_1]